MQFISELASLPPTEEFLCYAYYASKIEPCMYVMHVGIYVCAYIKNVDMCNNIIIEVTSHNIFHILLIRSKS